MTLLSEPGPLISVNYVSPDEGIVLHAAISPFVLENFMSKNSRHYYSTNLLELFIQNSVQFSYSPPK